MSETADLNKDEYESANGSPEKKIDTEVGDDEGEESDDYEEIDDEEERQIADEDEDEGEGEGGQQNTLTHLLIGNPNGATSAENEAEYYEEDDEEDDEVDGDDGDDDDDDDDEEYFEEEEENPIPLNKKRSIDEVVEKEASQGSKKIKA